MIAQNTMNATAIAMGYGLAVARAVGRNADVLRARLADGTGGTGPIRKADMPTLTKAGLVERGAAYVWGFKLTDAGRALAAKL